MTKKASRLLISCASNTSLLLVREVKPQFPLRCMAQNRHSFILNMIFCWLTSGRIHKEGNMFMSYFAQKLLQSSQYFSVQRVDAVHAQVEILLWMDTARVVDVDMGKWFLDSNLLEKSTSFCLEKSQTSYNLQNIFIYWLQFLNWWLFKIFAHWFNHSYSNISWVL